MARRFFSLCTPTGGVALTGGQLTTVIQALTAANHAAVILGVHVHFRGASNTNVPPEVYLCTQTSGGTMTGLTPVKKDPAVADTLDTTAFHTATAEPTTDPTAAPHRLSVHPQTGVTKYFGSSEEIILPAATRMGLLINSPDNVTVDVTIDMEE